ncbi:hypothetical protein CBZ_35430 [Cellulomonas biazotea]|uniref:Uncharacterized protein n=1 Tax=Cellulomonas biazotea TaxID=1709 RepID=A0A402DWJ3_9CELL|nr:hypothetical protein CBZ_35430 [Cellulomonas biazotea]
MPTDGLPAPVRRWLARAVPAGASTSSTAVVAMSGRIRVGAWRPFEARQVIAAGTGYVWAAVARFGRLPVLGYDRYSDGTGEMRWRLAGVVPVVTARGSDVGRSAAGRLAGEIVLNPGAALSPSVRWEPVDDAHALAQVTVDGVEHVVTIEVDAVGTVRSARVPRWGDPDGTGFAVHDFVARCTGDRMLGGYRVPARVVAGWDLDAPGAEPFIELEVDAATFR